MIRKIIAGILIVLGGLGIIVLVASGGPVLPHIVGPIVLVAIGIVLFALKRKTI